MLYHSNAVVHMALSIRIFLTFPWYHTNLVHWIEHFMTFLSPKQKRTKREGDFRRCLRSSKVKHRN